MHSRRSAPRLRYSDPRPEVHPHGAATPTENTWTTDPSDTLRLSKSSWTSPTLTLILTRTQILTRTPHRVLREQSEQRCWRAGDSQLVAQSMLLAAGFTRWESYALARKRTQWGKRVGSALSKACMSAITKSAAPSSLPK